MEKIDLTECNNLGYKAKVDGYNDHGRICVENVDSGIAFLLSYRDNGYVGIWSSSCPIVLGIGERKVIDFEIVPRDPETYRDWQVGDRATVPNEKWNDCAYKEIIFRSGELVICKDGNGDISGGYTCGQLHRLGYRLVLTDIERQIIEEKKKYEPQDGDIVAWEDEEDDGNPAVSIYKERNRGYATMFTNGLTEYSIYAIYTMNIIRPATDEEKQQLFEAMAKDGKRWNAEKKVVEDILKPYEFRKGEPVLVRDNGCVWKIGVFTEMRADYFQYGAMTNGLDECGYHYCLPYNERTMQLLGTSEDYKEGE